MRGEPGPVIAHTTGKVVTTLERSVVATDDMSTMRLKVSNLPSVERRLSPVRRNQIACTCMQGLIWCPSTSLFELLPRTSARPIGNGRALSSRELRTGLLDSRSLESRDPIGRP